MPPDAAATVRDDISARVVDQERAAVARAVGAAYAKLHGIRQLLARAVHVEYAADGPAQGGRHAACGVVRFRVVERQRHTVEFINLVARHQRCPLARRADNTPPRAAAPTPAPSW